MTRQYIDIQGKWGVLVYFHVGRRDLLEVADALRQLGCDEEYTDHAMGVLSGRNHALTFTNNTVRMSLVAIAETTSDAEFINSVAHEINHVRHHICKYYDIAEDSEDAAYLQGYIAMNVYKFVQR